MIFRKIYDQSRSKSKNLILEYSPKIISILNDRLEVEYFNENAYPKLLGYSKEQIIGRSFVKLIHPDDFNRIFRISKKGYEVIEGIGEARVKNNKGDYVWFENRGKVFKNNKDEKKIFLISRDITEKKTAKKALEESEDGYKKISIELENILDIIPGMVYYKDTNDVIIQANKHFADFFNLKKGEIIGKTTFDLFPIEQAKSIRRDDLKIINSGEPNFNIEQMTEFPIGNMWTLINKIPYFSENGQVIGIIGFLIDITERKKIENKIKIQNTFLNSVIEAIPHPFYVINADDYTIEIANSIALTENPSRDLTCYSLTHHRDKPCKGEFICPLEEVKKTKETKVVNHIHFDKNGNTKYYEVHGYPILDKDGNVAQMIEYSQDVTDRKMAEIKITDLAKFPSEDPNPVLRLNKEEVLYANHTSQKLFSIKEVGIIPEILKERVYIALEKNSIEEFELELKDKIYSLVIRPIKDLGYANIYGRDITERKKAEQELMESEEKFRTIAEESSLGLIIQQDGVIKFANSAVSDIIEYPLQEIMEQSVEDIFNMTDKEDLPIIIEKFKNRQNGDFDKINKFDCRIVPKSGKIRWIEVVSKPIIYLGKRAILASMIDITVKKQVEEKLKEINRLKSEFLSRTSHELKTPLISIKGFSDLILSLYEDQLDTPIISKLREINNGCERLQNIINNLLKTSKLESPELKPKLQKEDLSFLIKFCVLELESLAERRNQSIKLDIHNDLCANIEKEEIHDVLSNLLTNAIKYTPPMGKIEIKTELKDDSVVVSVNDNGIGFTEEQKTKIFQQFGKIERYGQGLDLGIDGTGLGLYISKKIVESHGGKIWMESEGKNKGASFYFTLQTAK